MDYSDIFFGSQLIRSLTILKIIRQRQSHAFSSGEETKTMEEEICQLLDEFDQQEDGLPQEDS